MNEFASGKYDQPSGIGNLTDGEVLLSRFGFVNRDDQPYTFKWAWWAVLICVLFSVLSIVASTFFLTRVRFAAGKSLATGGGDDDDGDDDNIAQNDDAFSIDLPFKKVDLTFKDIRYSVSSSVGDEKLELLKGIDGVVEAGKMTALVRRLLLDL